MVRRTVVRDAAHDPVDHPVGPVCSVPFVGVAVLVPFHMTPARQAIVASKATEVAGQPEFSYQDVADIARDVVGHPRGSVVGKVWVPGVGCRCGAPTQAFWGKPPGEELALKLPAAESRGMAASLAILHGEVRIQLS